MKAEPQREHQWLERLVGEWTLESEEAAQPGMSPGTWTESVRSLGGIWILIEGTGEMPGGGTGTTIMTLGYDPQRQRYVGTFVGSMMTHLWVYDGALDADARVLTLDTEGPGMDAEGKMTGKMTKYKDRIELKSDDHRVLTSHMLGDDGEWREFMTANYRRKR